MERVAPSDLRTEWQDADWWHNTAREHKLRLPMWRMRCTQGQMRRWLKKLNIDIDRYYSWWTDTPSEKNLRSFIKKNPSTPLRAWVGFMLELLWCDEQEANKTVETALVTPRKRGRPRKPVAV